MAIKELQTRIALKYDSYANWTDDTKEGLGANLVLLKGELGICAIEDKAQGAQTAPTVLFKVGDGTTPFKSLKWASALAADVYAWAKASDVRLSGKTIEFVGGKNAEGNDIIVKSIAINYATPEEVAAAVKVVSDNLAGVDARVVALEGKFEGEGSVDAKIAKAKQEAIDAAASDATAKAGTAETNAKTYTNEREVEINKAIAQAKADANGYTDGKVATINGELTSLDSRLDVIEGSGEGSVAKALADAKAYAESEADAAETAAKAYADGLASNYDAAGSAADALDDAKAYTDEEVEKLAAEDLRLAGLIGGNTTEITTLKNTTIPGVISDYQAADKAITDAIGTSNDGKDAATVYGAIAKAQADAEANAATTAQGKVDALADGQVKTNKEDIAGLKAADTEIRGLISAEQSRAEGIEGGLRSDVDNIKAFFATAENETLDTALDTLKEIQDYLNGEGTATNGMLGRLTQAEADIDSLQAEFTDGRVKAAEDKIAALEAKDTELSAAIDTKLASKTFDDWKTGHENDHAPSATKIASDIAAAVATEAGLREAADALINEKFGADYSKDATVASAIADAKAAGTGAASEATRAHGRLDVVEPKVTTLQDLVDGYTDKGSIKTAIDAAQGDATQALADAAKAQGEIDALELVVGDETTGLGAAHSKANKNAADITALDTRVTTAEGEIDALQAIVSAEGGNSNAKLREDITALQTLTAGFDSTTIKAAVDAAQKAGDDAAKAVTELANGQVATNKTNIETLDGRVTAIENDYLKAADLLIFQCGTATTVDHVAPAKA